MGELNSFTRGILTGLTVAAPVGPMAILCIRQTLVHGRAAGLMFGAGISTADCIFAAIGASGISAIAAFLDSHDQELRAVGGVVLVVIGLRIIRSSRRDRPEVTPISPISTRRSFVTAMGLTLANPMTILVFAAIVAGYGFGESHSAGAIATLAAGTFTGSLAWWMLLTQVTAALRTRITGKWINWVNLISGLAIGGLAIAALISASR